MATNYKQQSIMPPKQVVVVMQEDYPFGQCEECTTESTRVLVRKIYKIKSQERRKILQKMSVLRKLKNDYLIKIESVLEEEDCIHLLFQYIPIKLQTWISNINDQFIQNFRDQLIQLSEYLANYSIVTDFQLKNVGMDQNYGAKYFLDLNFETNTSINRQKLKSSYLKQINNLFKPYILTNKDSKISEKKEKETDISNIERSNKSYIKEAERPNKSYVKESQKPKRQQVDSAISPPTNKSIQNKHKQKALQKYYQEVNMSVDSENQKILQEFMDVLDNEEETSPKNFLPPTKNKNQFFLPAQPNSMQKKSSNNNNSNNNNNNSNNNSNQQNPFFHANQQNNSYQQKPSFAKFPKNSPQQNQSLEINQSQPLRKYVQPNQFTTLSNNAIPIKAQNQYTKTLQKMGRKSENNEDQRDIWRQSINLQSRVSTVIEKSREVIKRFKSVKVSPVV